MSYKPQDSDLDRDQSRRELVSVCQQVGQRAPLWLQGAGGNLSRKFVVDGLPRLWIKASGQRVDAVTPAKGLAEVDLSLFYRQAHATTVLPPPADVLTTPTGAQELAYKNTLAGSALTASDGVSTPSMETGLHALLPTPWVLHLHSLAALLMAHTYHESRSDLAWALKRHKMAVLPPLLPGLNLAWATARQAQSSHLILANHGVILALQDPGELTAWRQLEYEFCDKHGYDSLARLLSGDPTAAVPVRSRPMPLRFYFPDTAVFFAKMQPFLVPWTQRRSNEDLYLLETDDKDLQEIWTAQQILYEACPELPSLPDAIIRRVADLPTEQLRLAKSAS